MLLSELPKFRVAMDQSRLPLTATALGAALSAVALAPTEMQQHLPVVVPAMPEVVPAMPVQLRWELLCHLGHTNAATALAGPQTLPPRALTPARLSLTRVVPVPHTCLESVHTLASKAPFICSGS